MNLKDKVKPSAGVQLRNGDEVLKGEDYQASRSGSRLTRQQYQEKHASMQQRGV